MRTARIVLALVVALSLAGCGSAPDDAGLGPTPGPTAGGTGEASLLPLGQPVVTVDGTTVTVTGRGDGTSDPFPLSGAMLLSSSKCASSAASPFLWLYTKSGTGAGQFVDPENHLKNLDGEYYVRIASNADCVWTFTFTAE